MSSHMLVCCCSCGCTLEEVKCVVGRRIGVLLHCSVHLMLNRPERVGCQVLLLLLGAKCNKMGFGGAGERLLLCLFLLLMCRVLSVDCTKPDSPLYTSRSCVPSVSLLSGLCCVARVAAAAAVVTRSKPVSHSVLGEGASGLLAARVRGCFLQLECCCLSVYRANMPAAAGRRDCQGCWLGVPGAC